MPRGMQAIYSTTLTTTGITQVNFSNIPQTFTDLKVYVSARDGRTDAEFANIAVRLNGAGLSVYSNMNIAGTGGTASTDTFNSQVAYYYNLYANSASSTANVFSNDEMYIPNYTSYGFKQVLIDNATEGNSGNPLLVMNAGLYRGSGPITSITFFAQNIAFAQNSTFTLYGIGR